MSYHLAQINISRLVAPLDDPKIAEFVAQLEPINALADKAPGFVWRLQSESGNATDIAYSDDPFVIVNMSVWESIDTLREFATNQITCKCFATAPNGLKKPSSPAIACGGFRPATSPPSARAAGGWNITSCTARRRIPSGFRSSSLTRPTKASAHSNP